MNQVWGLAIAVILIPLVVAVLFKKPSILIISGIVIAALPFVGLLTLINCHGVDCSGSIAYFLLIPIAAGVGIINMLIGAFWKGYATYRIAKEAERNKTR